ncbi:clotting factor C-like isoform X2 [Linepithema humile]|uniref:clotting factor C-like isoform X2 n=1 Tax=Linepithema humile TaxID=83485 RepID=UPI00351E3753
MTCSALSEAHGAIRRCEAMWGPHKGWVPCNYTLLVGTRVFLECPVFYERRQGSSSVMCLHDGTWSQPPLSCAPICGTRESTEAALIIKGWRVKREEMLPWQATLFSHEDGQWRFFCGGTLVAERVVLTAGHCVWKTSADTVRVAFGILSSDLREAGENAQVIDVESIELQGAYQDHESNYASDIALLILKEAVTINSIVGPVCLPRNPDAILAESQKNGGLGLVAGMGLTENDTFSSVLRVTTMKIVSDDECRESQKKDFRKYLTYTSFCAGWENGTGVCNGDSGGGLVIQRPNSSVWEVHGVVSVSPRRLGFNVHRLD